MPSQGVNVYLDPWEKAQFEGHALCVQRIANILESTHHGVTCQRWHVRFHEDQENAVRWVDAGDFIDWVPPTWNVSIYQFSLPVANLSHALAWARFWIGDVQLYAFYPTVQMPYAGRIRAWSAATHVTERTGDPSKALIAISKNDNYWFSRTLQSSQTICTKAHDYGYDMVGRNFAQGDRLDFRIQAVSSNGDWTLVLQQNLLHVLIQWGNFP